MRERSGRSGRRRGSQKPGTTTARDGCETALAGGCGLPLASHDRNDRTDQTRRSAIAQANAQTDA
jgi:hypothetical protein